MILTFWPEIQCELGVLAQNGYFQLVNFGAVVIFWPFKPQNRIILIIIFRSNSLFEGHVCHGGPSISTALLFLGLTLHLKAFFLYSLNCHQVAILQNDRGEKLLNMWD